MVKKKKKNPSANAGDTGDLGLIPGSGRFSQEEEMATHSSILAWKISWSEELHGVQSRGCKKSDMTEHIHTHPYILDVSL